MKNLVIVLCLITVIPGFALIAQNNSASDESAYAELAYNKGIENISKKKFEEALLNFQEAIQYDQNHVKSYQKRGYVKIMLDDTSGALKDFNQAIAKDPDFAAAYYSRAYIYYNHHKYNKAVKDFEKTVDILKNKT